MKFDGEYDLQDGLGTPVKATASDNCDEIEIIAKGGKQGQQITRLVLDSETGELKMYVRTDRAVRQSHTKFNFLSLA